MPCTAPQVVRRGLPGGAMSSPRAASESPSPWTARDRITSPRTAASAPLGARPGASSTARSTGSWAAVATTETTPGAPTRIRPSSCRAANAASATLAGPPARKAAS